MAKDENGIEITPPSEVNVDGERVKQHSLKDQIEYDRYVEAKKKGPLRFAKIRYPGTAGR